MVRTHALMESVSANLHEFLHTIDTDLTRPQKKFLRDGFVGLLRAGRPVVCRMARTLPDQRTTFLSRLDRLEDNLNRQSALDQKLKVGLDDGGGPQGGPGRAVHAADEPAGGLG